MLTTNKMSIRVLYSLLAPCVAELPWQLKTELLKAGRIFHKDPCEDAL